MRKAIPPTFAIRHQMLDGVHYMHRPPTPRHQIVLMNVMRAVWPLERPGDTALPYIGVVLSPVDAVIPDCTYVSRERREIATGEYVGGAPDLDRYGRAGAAEHWLVDLDAEVVKVYRAVDANLTLVESVGVDGTITTSLLPELALPVREVFA